MSAVATPGSPSNGGSVAFSPMKESVNGLAGAGLFESAGGQTSEGGGGAGTVASHAPSAGKAEDPSTDTPKVLIDPTKDLWQNITLNVKDSNVEQVETSLLMVGSSGSGKSTLLHRIYSTVSGEGGGAGKKLKPTTALDYSFARRTDRNVSQVAHFWELGQGTELAQLSEVVVTPENVHSTALAVVVDASDAGLSVAWETATYWLKRIDRRVADVAQKMRAKGSSTPEKILSRAKRTIGVDHPDLSRMRLSGLPTVLVVSKLDQLSASAHALRVLTRGMRFLAHLYGAHLIFTCEAETAKWRALMSHVLFQAPFDAKNLQYDPERGGVLLTADKDSFADIGDPDVTDMAAFHGSTGDAELDRWKAPFDAVFRPEKLLSGKVVDDSFLKRLYDTSEDGFGEPAIDALRRQKDEELEQYRKSSKARSGK